MGLRRDILALLRTLNFPEDQRRGVRANALTKKKGFALGYVQQYFNGTWVVSRSTRAHPELARLLCEYAHEKIPHFKFTTIMVNEGRSALHVDTKNLGPSYIMSLGRHSGGGLWQYPGHELKIRNRLVECNGLLPHMTLPYDGEERYSVVFFTMFGNCTPAPSADRRFLRGLGFSAPRAKMRDTPPRSDLLPEAAAMLRRQGVSARDIGDYLNKTIPSMRRSRPALT